MNDERFEGVLEEMAKDYHEPPATPSDEMWARIQTLRLARARQKRSRIMRLSGWGIGIAAALVIGVGIGRRSATEQAINPDSAVAATDVPATDANALYQFAATQHLAQVESFLTMFRMDAAMGRPIDEVGASATDLLSTTRLYLDSPASEDPQLLTLLEDIELVLAQITQLTRDDSDEMTLIDESIEQRGVLLRLQSAVGADALAGAQGAL